MIPRSILLWAVIFAAISSIVKIAQAALVMILAAMLTPITYANFGILYALQSAMATLSVTGLSEYAIGNLPKSPSETSRLNLFRLISGAYIVVAVFSAIIIMAAAFLVMTDKGILFAGVLAIILGGIIAFGTLQSSLQRLEGQQKSSLYSGAAIGLAGTFGILIGVFLNADINTMFGFGLIGAVVVLIILINKKHFYLGNIPNFQVLFHIFRAILPYVIIGLLGWLTGYGMNFFIDTTLGNLQVAYFTFLFNIASIGQLLATSMNMSWGPHFFQIFQNNNENVESQTRRFYVLQSLGLALTGLVCVIALPYAANIIGGNLIYYANFKIELAFLFIGYIFCIPFWHSQNYYFATNKGDDLMYLSLWAGGIGFIAWIACMHFFGALGIYIGFPLQAAIKSGAGWIAAKKIWEIRPPIVIIVVSASIIFLGAYIPN